DEGGPGIAGRGEAAVEGPGPACGAEHQESDEEGHGVQGAADHRDLVSAGAQPGSGGAQPEGERLRRGEGLRDGDPHRDEDDQEYGGQPVLRHDQQRVTAGDQIGTHVTSVVGEVPRTPSCRWCRTSRRPVSWARWETMITVRPRAFSSWAKSQNRRYV